MADFSGNSQGSVAAQVQGLYVAYFNRPADAAGLAYWLAVLANGSAKLADVSAAFAASGEYQASYAGMQAGAVVNKVYHNLFGRPAETAGLAYWSALLGSGKLGVDNVVKQVAEGAQGSNRQVFSNKVSVASAFTSALDTPAEQLAYTSGKGSEHAALLLASIHPDSLISPTRQTQTIEDTIKSMLGVSVITSLGQNADTLSGGPGNDLFTAANLGGANTLQSADRIVAGGGLADQLRAVLTRGEGGRAPGTEGVEHVIIEAAASAGGADRVTVDTSNMRGVTQWESNGSSTDLVLEGVNTARTHASGNTTIVMRQTAPGDTDLGVYFDGYALRMQTSASSSLRMYLRNIDSDAATNPLQTPYNGVIMHYDGKLYTLTSPAIAAARSYEALAQGLRDAIGVTPGLEDIVVSLGKQFEVQNYNATSTLSGTEIVLTSPGGYLFDTSKQGYWNAPDLSTRLAYTNMSSLSPQPASPLALQLILDDVGRGGVAGDFFVGLTPTGSYNTAEITRLAVEVQDNSQLQTIGGGAGLEEIVFANGNTDSHGALDRVRDQGSLSVMGGSGTDGETLPGTPAGQSKGIGFSELRVLDASAMSGKFSFTAALSDEFLARHAGASAVVDVRYRGGSNDDSMQISISGNVLASNTHTLAQGDVSFSAEGGAGNDQIVVNIIDGNGGWLELQRGFANVAIDGGAGDDTIRVSGAGDSRITGGAGNDTIVLASGTSGRDTLVYAAQFGSDVVSNFQAGAGTVADRLDFSALGGNGSAFAGTAVSNSDHAITVQLLGNTNNTAARVAALYIDAATASSHVFVAYDGANVGQVYSVSDSPAGAVVATLVGSIDLGATSWATLAANNFV